MQARRVSSRRWRNCRWRWRLPKTSTGPTSRWPSPIPSRALFRPWLAPCHGCHHCLAVTIARVSSDPAVFSKAAATEKADLERAKAVIEKSLRDSQARVTALESSLKEAMVRICGRHPFCTLEARGILCVGRGRQPRHHTHQLGLSRGQAGTYLVGTPPQSC